MTANGPHRTPLLLILCAWVAVAVPLGWGLYQSVVKSRPLFAPAAPAASVAPTAPAAAPAVAPSK
jgi:hypothetical protein